MERIERGPPGIVDGERPRFCKRSFRRTDYENVRVDSNRRECRRRYDGLVCYACELAHEGRGLLRTGSCDQRRTKVREDCMNSLSRTAWGIQRRLAIPHDQRLH
jgi:hypothetical protein